MTVVGTFKRMKLGERYAGGFHVTREHVAMHGTVRVRLSEALRGIPYGWRVQDIASSLTEGVVFCILKKENPNG